VKTDHLIFNPGSTVRFGSNSFVNVPVILQVDDKPIIEVVTAAVTLRTTQFEIYDPNGIYVAKVVGPRLFLTNEGAKSGLKLHHPSLMTVCTLGTNTLFEIRRQEAGAIAIAAELYTSTGSFIKSSEAAPLTAFSKDGIEIGRSQFVGCHFENLGKAFWIKSDGSMQIACP
jgi:hypothetical protein